MPSNSIASFCFDSFDAIGTSAFSFDKSVPYISYIEGGKTKFSLHTLVSIANAFEVSVDYLLEGNLIHLAQYRGEEWQDLLGDCTPYECRIILELAYVVKGLLRER